MLASGDAKRWQLASVATLVSHALSVRLLPLLKRLLDDNLDCHIWRQCVRDGAPAPCLHRARVGFGALLSEILASQPNT
jgi:hypothetical protein